MREAQFEGRSAASLLGTGIPARETGVSAKEGYTSEPFAGRRSFINIKTDVTDSGRVVKGSLAHSSLIHYSPRAPMHWIMSSGLSPTNMEQLYLALPGCMRFSRLELAALENVLGCAADPGLESYPTVSTYQQGLVRLQNNARYLPIMSSKPPKPTR